MMAERIYQALCECPDIPCPFHTPHIIVRDKDCEGFGWICVMAEDRTYKPLDYIRIAK